MILPGAARHVPPSRGATISARASSACDFGGQKEEAAPLPGPCGHFAVRPRVSGGPHWQALCGPLVVELFAVAVSLRAIPGPGLVAGPPGRPGGCSPRQRGCAARDRDINPDSRRGFRPRPPGGIPTRFASERPRARRGACPRRPRSSGLSHRVEPPGCPARSSSNQRVLAGGAPVAPDVASRRIRRVRAGRSWRRVRPPPFPPSVAGSPGAGRRSVPPPAARCARPTASGRVLHAQVEHRCRRISTRIDPTAWSHDSRNRIGPGRSRPHRDSHTARERSTLGPPRRGRAMPHHRGRPQMAARPQGVGPRTRRRLPARDGRCAPEWPACRRIDSA